MILKYFGSIRVIPAVGSTVKVVSFQSVVSLGTFTFQLIQPVVVLNTEEKHSNLKFVNFHVNIKCNLRLLSKIQILLNVSFFGGGAQQLLTLIVFLFPTGLFVEVFGDLALLILFSISTS